ncbi:hypothetical protein ACFVSW_27825 [Neobacillus sp. NPDC058068]|uniref:hypothetical protein n=1 Tax=Neobacillus sp. NPDC058068 TaxID=3346325 RepID=UPI0036D9EAC5
MQNKIKIIISISLILVVSYFINIALKDDIKEIEKAVYSLNQPFTKIAYIKFLDNNQAIVFYEHASTNIEYFGNIRLKKNIFGWKLGNSSSGQTPNDHKLDWHYSNLKNDFSKYTDVLSGKILDSEIKEVFIVTKNNKEYQAKIIKYYNGNRFWYLVTDGEELPGSTVTGLSIDGKIIEEIKM